MQRAVQSSNSFPPVQIEQDNFVRNEDNTKYRHLSGVEIRDGARGNCLESRRVWVPIPPEQSFLYENRKEGSQVRFFALSLKSKVCML